MTMATGKSWSLSEIVIPIIVIVFFIVIVWYFVGSFFKDYDEYKTYKTFCEEKPSFCYCSQFACEYKTQWSSVNGLSNDTIELCKLANKLNDKETLFKAGCNNE